ncbi:Hypothetical protein FKW44_022287 [Caligus rogercresseyi]|uniref:Uncharacterized protein n=1 Tax=Caligus rogercresseyi TaxID=217165 RepID=A0A7T8GSM8_CALRO|nr:Hypothetical protein FKW44_022287 [Caligus rogercresseyi]
MGPRVLPNTIGVFWGYKSTANGHSGSAEHNRGVLGLQIQRQWALMFRRTQSGCFGVTNPRPMGPWVPSNTIGMFWGHKSPANGPLDSAKPIRVFWGYKSPANGPLCSAKPNRGVLGLQIHRQWPFRFRRTQSGCFGVTNPPAMGAWVPPNLIGVFWGYKSTTNGPLGSAKPHQGVLGLQIHRQWALRFR